ncbi:thioredoxin family protein [Alteromonas sp. A079]|uniref:thioredoxin family protein n=1 Tax=Alteromonas sp. A079 TaxID=3410268 RepID=UPI003BA0BEC6
MNRFFNIVRHLTVFSYLTLSILFTPFCLASAENTPDTDVIYQYIPEENAVAALFDSRQHAIENNKRLLVVLGAQWCHDSRGLAAQFSSEPMQEIIQNDYEVKFIDVGLLEDRRAITTQFNYPTYYATPTVMVIDPQTNTLLNADSMDKWAFADSVPPEDYVDYFGAFQNKATNKPSALTQYDVANAKRLQNAYDILGPMLGQDIAGNAPDGFYDLWKEVRTYRISLQKSLATQAATYSEDDGNKREAYGPFSWENE